VIALYFPGIPSKGIPISLALGFFSWEKEMVAAAMTKIKVMNFIVAN
jgi:hypothetical protein